MNGRIQQLAEQAGYHPDVYELCKPGMDMFAELLIEECIGQCWTVSELESNGYVVSECSKKIRKHFGIEQ